MHRNELIRRGVKEPAVPHMFKRPEKSSKAIAIVNPQSGESVSVKQQEKPTTAPTTEQRTEPSQSLAKKAPVLSLNSGAVTKDEDVGRAFNVYAHPFVPRILMDVNRSVGPVTYHTRPERLFIFEQFAGDALPLKYMPAVPGPTLLVPLQTQTHVLEISPRAYEEYFAHHLYAEVESQKQENDSLALYAHDVAIQLQEGKTTFARTCRLQVPGLRENSPYLEEDDIVQLRQLRHDPQGRLAGPEFGGPWMGIVYNARVARVLRAKQELILEVEGLSSVSLDHDENQLPGVLIQLSKKFNIVFPVSGDRYMAMQHALSGISKALRSAYEDSYQHLALDDTSPPLETSHMAQSYWVQSMLFPTEVDCEVQSKLNPGQFSRSFYDEDLNWEQKKAVQSICLQDYGTLPYLISGPPGTGKTKTLIETALQLIYNVDQIFHILLCAPSDPAADTLAERLRNYLSPNELLRLNRPTRTSAEVPSTLLPYCFTSAKGTFDLPGFERLMAYKVVVTTCRDAFFLMLARSTNADLHAMETGFRNAVRPFDTKNQPTRLHWSALLLDEAAQALEPEALVPISVVAPPKAGSSAPMPLVVMAGDEFQLGPRTSLPRTPLKHSLFARLFSRPAYAKHPLARSKKGATPPPLSKAMLPILRPPFANLNRNYRSHPAILAVPSHQFYFDTLEPCATETNRLASWNGWHGRRWPMLFHRNSTRDELEMDGGGWYNIGEANLACRYAASLVGSGLVQQNEVCIMSPFKAQVRLLRLTMQRDEFGAMWDVNIGPTEAFQGLEKGVVILCTTRSKTKFVEKDIERGWGIIGHPNKMNVALTRAKFGLVVIGKREVLSLDEHWRAVLAFCDRNGLVVGDEDPESGAQLVANENDIPDLTRLEKVLLAEEGKATRIHDYRVMECVEQQDEMWQNEIPYDE